VVKDVSAPDRASLGGSALVASSSGPQTTPTALMLNSGVPRVSPLEQSQQPSSSRGTDNMGSLAV